MLMREENRFASGKQNGTPFSLGALKSLALGRVPGQMVIQYTDRCNATCAQCGMRVTNKFERTTMDPDQVRRLLDAAAERGVQAVSFTGGEPLLCLDQIAPLMRHAREAGIRYVRTGTNGFIFRGHDKADFQAGLASIAETLVRSGVNNFWISVDSADPATHEANRGLEGVIKGIEKGLPVFHSHGLYPSANLGINRSVLGSGANRLQGPGDAGYSEEGSYLKARRAFRAFYSFVESLGFTTANACYPMSLEQDEADRSAVYSATSTESMISFEPREKAILFKALFHTIPEFRSRLRIFTPRSSLLALVRQHEGGSNPGYACRGGIDFFFVDSRDMNTYPCGYRGEDNLGKFWDLDMKALQQKPWCRKCDWECFRDPSELLGPLMDGLRKPWTLLGKRFADPLMVRVRKEDMRYYRACGYFNARQGPDMKRLARFAQGLHQATEGPDQVPDMDRELALFT